MSKAIRLPRQDAWRQHPYHVRMQLIVNGQPAQFPPEGLTVARLLELKGLAQQPCAVEVNKNLVSKKHHAQHTLQDNDAVEIVTLVGGG